MANNRLVNLDTGHLQLPSLQFTIGYVCVNYGVKTSQHIEWAKKEGKVQENQKLQV